MSRIAIRMVLPVVLVVTLSCASAGAGARTEPQRPGNGVTAPQLVRDAKPQYTAAALKERVEGSVWLELLVKEDGLVGDVKVIEADR